MTEKVRNCFMDFELSKEYFIILYINQIHKCFSSSNRHGNIFLTYFDIGLLIRTYEETIMSMVKVLIVSQILKEKKNKNTNQSSAILVI